MRRPLAVRDSTLGVCTFLRRRFPGLIARIAGGVCERPIGKSSQFVLVKVAR